MGIDFPNAPAYGDVFSSGNVAWTWNGVAWAASVPPALMFDTLPVNALNDAAAASAGVIQKGIYRNGSVLMVRVV